jgi:CubicO group peptidase (beta-lactamase class C family)
VKARGSRMPRIDRDPARSLHAPAARPARPLENEGKFVHGRSDQSGGNHAEGYRNTPDESVEVPFEQLFPYDYRGAGDINSTIEDMALWVRLNLGNGAFEGKPIVSSENLAMTRPASATRPTQHRLPQGRTISAGESFSGRGDVPHRRVPACSSSAACRCRRS